MITSSIIIINIRISERLSRAFSEARACGRPCPCMLLLVVVLFVVVMLCAYCLLLFVCPCPRVCIHRAHARVHARVRAHSRRHLDVSVHASSDAAHVYCIPMVKNTVARPDTVGTGAWLVCFSPIELTHMQPNSLHKSPPNSPRTPKNRNI